MLTKWSIHTFVISTKGGQCNLLYWHWKCISQVLRAGKERAEQQAAFNAKYAAEQKARADALEAALALANAEKAALQVEKVRNGYLTSVWVDNGASFHVEYRACFIIWFIYCNL